MTFLPKEKSKPLNDMTQYIIMMYGVPKIGKSTFASQMDDPLFLATEQGLHALEVYQTEIKTWEDFIGACAELHKSKRFKTVIIDTVDNAYQMCLDYVCKAHGIKHPSDLEWGKGWSLVNKEFQRVLTKLSHEGRGLVFLSHSQDITIKTRTSEITKAVPTLVKSARKFILGISDIIMYAEMEDTKDGLKRVIHCEPSENWEAGDRTGRLPAVLPLDYNAVKKAFQGGKK